MIKWATLFIGAFFLCCCKDDSVEPKPTIEGTYICVDSMRSVIGGIGFTPEIKVSVITREIVVKSLGDNTYKYDTAAFKVKLSDQNTYVSSSSSPGSWTKFSVYIDGVTFSLKNESWAGIYYSCREIKGHKKQ